MTWRAMRLYFAQFQSSWNNIKLKVEAKFLEVK
jgi:hypothetical protein